MHHCVPIDGAAHRASLTLLVSIVCTALVCRQLVLFDASSVFSQFECVDVFVLSTPLLARDTSLSHCYTCHTHDTQF
jgi:hypothetical protein